MNKSDDELLKACSKFAAAWFVTSGLSLEHSLVFWNQAGSDEYKRLKKLLEETNEQRTATTGDCGRV